VHLYVILPQILTNNTMSETHLPQEIHISGHAKPGTNGSMNEIEYFLDDIGLGQYLESFIDHGFDTLDIVGEMTDPDL
jgi:hypothetical protein